MRHLHEVHRWVYNGEVIFFCASTYFISRINRFLWEELGTTIYNNICQENLIFALIGSILFKTKMLVFVLYGCEM